MINECRRPCTVGSQLSTIQNIQAQTFNQPNSFDQAQMEHKPETLLAVQDQCRLPLIWPLGKLKHTLVVGKGEHW